MNPPRLLDGARVLAVADLAEAASTGRTGHVRDGEVQESIRFAHLVVASYDGSSEVYLFYCDANWIVLNDTAHDSRISAEGQARFEFDRVNFRDIV